MHKINLQVSYIQRLAGTQRQINVETTLLRQIIFKTTLLQRHTADMLIWRCMASGRADIVKSTLKQRCYVKSIFKQRCYNVMTLKQRCFNVDLTLYVGWAGTHC